jgi:hypothetical protein
VYVSAVFRKSRNRGFGRTSLPRELGGSNGGGTNSEQLFAAAYTSSFLGMPRLVAAREGMALPPDAVIRHSSGTRDLFAAAAALRGRRASEEGARPVLQRHAITSLLGRSLPEDCRCAKHCAVSQA